MNISGFPVTCSDYKSYYDVCVWFIIIRVCTHKQLSNPTCLFQTSQSNCLLLKNDTMQITLSMQDYHLDPNIYSKRISHHSQFQFNISRGSYIFRQISLIITNTNMKRKIVSYVDLLIMIAQPLSMPYMSRSCIIYSS